MKIEKIERIDRQLVAKGTIIDYYHDIVKIPNGNIVTWDFIGNKGAAAVIPVKEDGKIIMVRQYRNAIERETIEIPAGGLNHPQEPTLQGAVEPVFALLALFSAAHIYFAMPWLLSFSAGAMLYVSARELLTRAESMGGAFGYIGGFSLMMLLDTALG